MHRQNRLRRLWAGLGRRYRLADQEMSDSEQSQHPPTRQLPVIPQEREVSAKIRLGGSISPEDADIELDRDIFLRTLVRELAGTLESVVGIDEASGFVSVVGQRIGEWINSQYMRAAPSADWDAHRVAATLIDLKRRIKGDFYLVSLDDDEIVLGNRACPFGEKVKGRPSMCMMTSNVFGHIAADHLGYARVVLDETIAEGAVGCRVRVKLRPGKLEREARAREYFGPSGVGGES